MVYRVIKTVKGRRYVYEQRTWREGKRVRTESRYIGPVDEPIESALGVKRRRGVAAFLAAQQLSPEDRMMASAERRAAEIDQYQREHFGETASERTEREYIEHLAQLYSAYGLTVSDPKVAAAAKAAAAGQSAPAADANESPSSEEGQGSGGDAPDSAQNN